MLRHAFLLGCLAALGCGGQTDADGSAGSGGASTGGTGGVVSSGGVSSGGSAGDPGPGPGPGPTPTQCSVGVTEPGPYPTTIRFLNPSDMELAIPSGCEIEWDLLGCPDDYQTPLVKSPGCTGECSDTTGGCVMCEPCPPPENLFLPPGGSVDVQWNGNTYAFGQSAGCACHYASYAPPGKYAARVSVYSKNAESGWDAIEYFELPAKTGVVEVPLVKIK